MKTFLICFAILISVLFIGYEASTKYDGSIIVKLTPVPQPAIYTLTVNGVDRAKCYLDPAETDRCNVKDTQVRIDKNDVIAIRNDPAPRSYTLYDFEVKLKEK